MKVIPEISSPRPAVRRVLFIVNTARFFVSHRLPLAIAARSAGYDVHVAASLDALDAATLLTIGEAGLQIHELHLSRSGAGPVELIRNSRELFVLMKRLRPDIVHLVTLKPVLIGGMIGRLLRLRAVILAIPGRGSVFTSTGFLASLRRMLVLQSYRAAYRRGSTHVIVQNVEDRDYFVSRGI